MASSTFYPQGEGIVLRQVAELVGGELEAREGAPEVIRGIAAVSDAGPEDVALFDNPRYAAALEDSGAGCILVQKRHVPAVPDRLSRIVVAADAGAAFGALGRLLFPAALAPRPVTGETGISPNAHVDPTAEIEPSVVVEAFAVVGPGAKIGQGTVVSSGATIAAGCTVGRNCRIGAHVALSHALLGDRVILHPGVKIGQDGFGFVAGRSGLDKVVQIGRVIVQDDVEIGANSTVDRGGVRDTVIGEGTKIDNQVQVAHNVVIGRHCVIVSQVGISGSATLGDGVMIGGKSGINGHISVGSGAQIAAVSTVAGDVPAKARWGGTPAKPVREWFREITLLSELAKKRRGPEKNDDE